MTWRDLLVLLSIHEESPLGCCPLFTMGTCWSVAIASVGHETDHDGDIACQRQRRHSIGAIGYVTQWASLSGRAGRPGIQPHLHPLPLEQRPSQTVSTRVTDYVTT